MSRPTIATLLARAEVEFGIPRSLIVGPLRFQRLCKPRFAVQIAARSYGYSYSRIGQVFNGRDHSSVISGCDRAAHWASVDPDYAEKIERIAS